MLLTVYCVLYISIIPGTVVCSGSIGTPHLIGRIPGQTVDQLSLIPFKKKKIILTTMSSNSDAPERSSSIVEEEEKISACGLFCTGLEMLMCCGAKTNPLGKFVIAHKAHTMNLYVSHVLFWAIAIPQTIQTGLNYDVGYKQSLVDNADAANGRIQSGRFGEGAFPMIFMVTFVATAIWLEAMYQYCTKKEEENKEE